MNRDTLYTGQTFATMLRDNHAGNARLKAALTDSPAAFSGPAAEQYERLGLSDHRLLRFDTAPAECETPDAVQVEFTTEPAQPYWTLAKVLGVVAGVIVATVLAAWWGTLT